MSHSGPASPEVRVSFPVLAGRVPRICRGPPRIWHRRGRHTCRIACFHARCRALFVLCVGW
eukprot:15432159-Alexandrium_andersonii.AAC.1